MKIIGHRGAMGLEPENTLRSIGKAMEIGVDMIEFDVYVLKTGEVILMHDNKVNRTTNGRGLVRDMTYADLRRLDAGEGEHLPLLQEVLALDPRVGLNIEIKVPEALAPTLAALRPDTRADILLTASDDAIMKDLEAHQTRYGLGLSRAQVKQALLGAYTFGVSFFGRALQIPPAYRGLPLLTRQVVRAAHRASVEVHVWTINNAAEAKVYLEMGVDGIMTDDPAALRSLFKH